MKKYKGLIAGGIAALIFTTAIVVFSVSAKSPHDVNCTEDGSCCEDEGSCNC